MIPQLVTLRATDYQPHCGISLCHTDQFNNDSWNIYNQETWSSGEHYSTVDMYLDYKLILSFVPLEPNVTVCGQEGGVQGGMSGNAKS